MDICSALTCWCWPESSRLCHSHWIPVCTSRLRKNNKPRYVLLRPQTLELSREAKRVRDDRFPGCPWVFSWYERRGRSIPGERIASAYQQFKSAVPAPPLPPTTPCFYIQCETPERSARSRKNRSTAPERPGPNARPISSERPSVVKRAAASLRADLASEPRAIACEACHALKSPGEPLSHRPRQRLLRRRSCRQTIVFLSRSSGSVSWDQRISAPR